MIWLRPQEDTLMDQEVFSHLFDHLDMSDLSVGDAGGMVRDVDNGSFQSETFIAPTEHLPAQRQHPNQHQHNRKANEKRLGQMALDIVEQLVIQPQVIEKRCK